MAIETQKARPMSGQKIALIVAGALGLLGVAAVCGVKNVSVWSEFSGKVFNLKNRACMPRLDLELLTAEPYQYRRQGSNITEANKNHKVLPDVETMVRSMSIDECIGQMLQPEAKNTHCYEVRDSKAGGMFFGGSSNPGEDKAGSWASETKRIQREAVNTKPHHIPIFIGQDTIHGMSHVKGATHFPHNIGLGCMHDETAVEKVGRITALEASAVGVNWGFSPCVAVATDIRWGRIYESFGQDGDHVGRMGAAYVKGANSVDKPFITCGKHFVGDGGVKYGTGRIKQVDRGDTQVNEDELRRVHLKPYEYLVKAGVKSMMASYSSVNGKLNHGNKHLMTNVLKGELGFKGFISSDYAGIDPLARDYKVAVAKAINAGVDQIMLATADRAGRPGPAQLARAIKHNVKSGQIPESRVRDAARRILWAKYSSGLMTHKHNFEDPHASLSIVGHQDHKAFNREVVAKTVVPLKNEHDILPLSLAKRKICVAGQAGDDEGMQLGGWTLDWQSHTGKLSGHKVTTVYEGLKAAAEKAGVGHHVKYNAEGNCQGSDVALVVVGEAPYAEFMGDRVTVPQPPDLKLVKKIKNQLNMPVILLVIAGRPIDIEAAASKAHAVAAAFLPGSEGGHGIADVLLGKKAPSGRLSMDWPASGHSVVRIAKDSSLIYRSGDGLTWSLPTQ